MRVIFSPSARSGAASHDISGMAITAGMTVLVMMLLIAGALIDRATRHTTLHEPSALPPPVPIDVDALREKIDGLEHRYQVHRRDLDNARIRFSEEADVIGARVGQLQAQVVRLNALGERLVTLAGLPETEFNFTQLPALGGPAEPLDAATEANGRGAIDQAQVKDMLARLGEELQADTQRLAVLESLIQDRDLVGRLAPTGWPSEGGWISSSFGARRDPFTGKMTAHKGVDIANELGAPILSAADGVVTFSGNRAGFGRLVEINHGSGYVTRYAHAQALEVSTSDRVARGEAIATVGRSGRATGPHLHFEVLFNGQHIDPKTLLEIANPSG